jgi:tetratricopeptide (TPR) repeat protein
VLASAGGAALAALLVIAHLQASYWANSERLFRHALAITGDNFVACENMGDALLHQDQYAEAEVQFRKVLAIDAEHSGDARSELVQALAGQGKVGDAIAFAHAIADKPERAKAMNDLAMFMAPKLLHLTEDIQLFQEAIELAPQQPAGLRNLAWVYATCPDHRFRNGPKAVELARRACELSEWKNATYRKTLAAAYLETGDTDRAIEELQAVIRLSPGDEAASKQLESLLRQHQ